MDRTYYFRDLIEKLLDQMSHHRPTKGVVHSVVDNVINLSLGGFPSLVKSARVIGDITKVSRGSIVDILWDKDRPVVLIGGGSGTTSVYRGVGGSTVDDRTIENSHEGIRVKAGGLGVRHLNFAPAMADHTHPNPLVDGGWEVTEEGVLFNGLTALHPNGDIVLGEGIRTIHLSSTDPHYRLWAGGAQGQGSKFSIDANGRVTAVAGKIGGWQLGENRFFSDLGNDGKPRAEINAENPFIQLGGCSYLDGEGFWVGKHGSLYRLKIGSQESFLRWNGRNLEIQGDMQSANYVPGVTGWRVAYNGLAEFRSGIIGGWNVHADRLESDNGNVKIKSSTPSIQMGATDYLEGSGFWVGKDGANYKMFVGNQENFLAWNGTTLMLAAELRSTNYIPGISGWIAKPSGDAEFRNVKVRGSIESSVIEYEQVLSVDGGLIITKTSSLINEDFTALTESFDVSVKIPDGVGHSDIGNYYAVGDVVRVKSGFTNFWGNVVQITDNTTYWTLAIDKIDPEFDVEVKAGSTLLNYGMSGNGVIELDGKSPMIRLYSHEGAPHLSAKDFVIIGNLKDHFGYTDDELGFGVGDPNRIDNYLFATEDGLELSGVIRLGAETFDLGKGLWAGKDEGEYKFRVGDPGGHMLSWNGERLSIVGDIVITGGSGLENIEGLGLLAMQNSVDWEQIDGDGKPESNATVGATWGQNLFGVPPTLQDPNASGLYLSSNKMGFYNGADWITYIDNQGKFFFRGTDDAHLSWDPVANKLFGHDGENVQWYASSKDGKFYAGEGTVILDELGISIIGDRTAFYFIDDDIPVGTMRIMEDLEQKKIIRIINGMDASETNLIVNGNFDVNTAGWTITGNGVLPHRSTENTHLGAGALKFTPFLVPENYLVDESGNRILTEDGENILFHNPDQVVQNQAVSTPIDVLPGEVFGVRAFVHQPDKDYMNFTAHVLFYNNLDVVVRERELNYSMITKNEWSLVAMTVNINPGEYKMAIRFRVNQGYGGIDESPQALYVDEIGVFDLSKYNSQVSLGYDYVRLDADSTYVSGDLQVKGMQKGGQTVYLQVFYDDEDLETGNGALWFTVPPALDGCRVKSLNISCYTASTSGKPTVNLRNSTKDVDILSTAATIDVSHLNSMSASVQPVINLSNNTLHAGDRLRVDVTAQGTGTKGLDVFFVASQP